MLTLNLPDSTAQRLADAAARSGHFTSAYLENIITEHLEELEDIREAEAVLERVRRGEERVYSLKEMEQSIGLDD